MLLWYYIRALIKSAINTAPVAQLDRAFDYESKGCEFDSCPAHHYRDVAQLGSALDLGSRGHRFESCHPDHYYGEVAQFIPGRSWVRVPPSLPLFVIRDISRRYVLGPLAQLVRAVGS